MVVAEETAGVVERPLSLLKSVSEYSGPGGLIDQWHR